MSLSPERTVAELRELQELTGDENGAQRVAWTETWERARQWLREKVAPTGAEEEIDEAGNQWFTLAGRVGARAPARRPHRLGAERRLARRLPQRRSPASRCCGGSPTRATPPLTVRLVNWADEEGARFGRSLFGSSRRRRLDERPGRAARSGATPTASRCRTRSPSTASISTARSRRARSSPNAAAYLELHIEQGPVLESLDLPLGVVLGTFGVERHLVTWHGQAAHAGSTPMDQRRDALAGAAKLALEIRADRGRSGGRRGLHVAAASSAGRASSPPSSRPRSSSSTSATSTPRSSHGCSSSRKRRSERFAHEEDIDVEWQRIWGDRADPVRRRPDRARRRVDPRGRRALATAFRRGRSTTPPRSHARESRP